MLKQDLLRISDSLIAKELSRPFRYCFSPHTIFGKALFLKLNIDKTFQQIFFDSNLIINRTFCVGKVCFYFQTQAEDALHIDKHVKYIYKVRLVN